MAIINLNINGFKKNLGGIANRLVNNAINKVEQKFENAVEDAFAKGLKKIGLSDTITSDLSARFGDAFSVGQADNFFGTSTAEQNRISSKKIVDNVLNLGAETAADAQQAITYKVQANTALLQFPPDIGAYYMSLNFTEYARPSPQAPATRKSLKKFNLPIPRELKEQFSNIVDSKGIGVFTGGLADIGTDAFRGGKGAGGKAVGQLDALTYATAVQAIGDYGDIIGQFGGAVPNPHLQNIFSGVQMRSHSFQWTFSPRNSVESIQLQQIIYELKKFSLPAFSNLGTAALQYPPLVDIELWPWKGKKGEDLIVFKPCMVQNISVNYSPQGIPAFFKGTNQPIFIQVSIDFIETEIQTAYDYGTNPGDRGERTDQVSKLYEQLKAEAPPALAAVAASVSKFGTGIADVATVAAQKAN